MTLRPFASCSGNGVVSHVPHVSHPLPQLEMIDRDFLFAAIGQHDRGAFR